MYSPNCFGACSQGFTHRTVWGCRSQGCTHRTVLVLVKVRGLLTELCGACSSQGCTHQTVLGLVVKGLLTELCGSVGVRDVLTELFWCL